MEALKRKRTVLKGRITRISNILNPKFEAGVVDVEELDMYKLQVEEIWADLNHIHTEIILVCDEEDQGSFSDEYNDFASKIDALRLKMARERTKANIKLQKGVDSAVDIEVKSRGSESCLKLPKFELPPFYGEVERWLSFKELFLTSIDKNSELTELQRFQYLLASAKGSAHKLISGFSLTEGNYKHAWETLCSRYDNKRELVFAQISKLFSLKAIKSGSSKSVFEILDTCNEVIRILLTLKLEVNSMVDVILIHFILGKLDDTLRQRWELSLTNQDIPKFSDLVRFLERQAKSMLNKDTAQLETKQTFGSKKSVVTNVVVDKNEKLCSACRESHFIFKCPVFNKMSLDERWNLVRAQRLCANCLRKGHFANKCLSNSTCKSCHKKHHTLLHRFYPNVQANSNLNNVFAGDHCSNLSVNGGNSGNFPQVKESIQLGATCHVNSASKSNTLLSTALVKIRNKRGDFVACRALVDNGSQKSLISKACAALLQLEERVSNNYIAGVNGIVIDTTLSEVNLTFMPHFAEKVYECSALVVNKITSDLPNFKFDSSYWPHLHGLVLADPTFFVSNPIDILLGADIYADLLLGEPIFGAKGTPSAINSRLGWLVSGRIFSNSKPAESFVSCHLTSGLENQLKSFWELESVPQTELRSKDDTSCECFYKNTVVRDALGRYTVKLPFKFSADFGDSATQALRRFHYLESKLSKNCGLREQYSAFMSEYLELGHMEAVPPDEIDGRPVFYLPHHFVIKEDSSTTKLRVVFDASAKDSSGKSLNSTLHLGPRLQPELFSSLLKFRSFRVAVSADIEKMFRQVRVDKNDADFQRIFWRFDPEEDVQIYRLLTVTYGTAAAPYLAVRTLQQLAKDEEVTFPESSRVLMEDFYVDDLLSGADTIAEAKLLVSNLSKLLQSGGFNLRKWASSCPEVLNNVPDLSLASHHDIAIEEIQAQKVLGLYWNSKQDTLQVNFSQPEEVTSKRKLLSVIARTFDPLGFLSPTTIMLKIMMQALWKNKLSWDDPVPEEILSTWKTFQSEMNHLQEIKVKRGLKPANTPVKTIQLHGFCDASVKAYSAVFYMRVIDKEDMVTVNLLASKTKVAPLKPTSLPRLELCAAHLLAKLYDAITSSMNKFWDQVFLWSDSEIVLSWIRCDTQKDQFVRNRTAMITSLTESAIWRHVPGVSNPADCASRGIFPKKLKDFNLWWHGPTWLSEDSSEILVAVAENVPVSDDLDLIEGSTSLDLDTDAEFEKLFQRYSSYSKLLRVIAWCRRFIFNTKNQRRDRLRGGLKSSELNSSLLCIVKQVQKINFKSEIASLDAKGSLPKTSVYISLSPFLDSEKILRVGGRLKNSSLSSDAKHPILLPKRHHITRLIV